MSRVEISLAFICFSLMWKPASSKAACWRNSLKWARTVGAWEAQSTECKSIVPLWGIPTEYNVAEYGKLHNFIKYLFFSTAGAWRCSKPDSEDQRISLKSDNLKYWQCLLRITAPPLEWWLLLLFWLLLQLLVPWYWAAGVTCVCRGSVSLKMRKALWVKEKPKSLFFWCSTLLKDLV